MFDRDEVEALLDMQRRSYTLLRWVGEKVEAGTLPLGSLHGALDAPQAAVELTAAKVLEAEGALRTKLRAVR